jgi:enoyl-CoA hydratase
VVVNEFVSVYVSDERPGVGTVVLSRPPTNKLTRQAYREIEAAAAEVGARDDVDAVIVFGGHEIFSAGDDLDELRTLNASRADAAARLRQAAIDAVAAIPKPTVAAVTGYALGSGLGLAMAADWRVCGDNAKLGFTDILAGLIPSGGATQRLPRAIGVSKAKDLVFSGRFVDAKEALRIGLLDEMVAPDNVYDAAAAWAARFVGGPSRARAAAKAAIDGRGDERRLYVEVFGEADRRFVGDPGGR